MNAINFLIKEHNEVRTTLADIANKTPFDSQKKAFELLAEDLIRHENMEHEVWYPHFVKDLPEEVKHLLKEEKTAENAINKLRGLKTETSWNDHFKSFKQDVEHHAQEEEQKLFPAVEKILSKSKLDEIGVTMSRYKKEYPSNKLQ